MKERFKLIRGTISEYWTFSAVLAAALTIYWDRPMRFDDSFFAGMFSRFHGNVLSFAQEYWTIWSGRVVPHSIFVILLHLSPRLVNLVSAVVAAFLVRLMASICVPEKQDVHLRSFVTLLIFVFFYLFTPSDLLDVTVFWKTAEVLYIWAFFAMLIALLPFIRLGMGMRPLEGWRLAAAFFASIYAAGFEESGAFFIGFGLLSLIKALFDRRKIPLSCIVLYLLGSGLSVLFFLAPGNQVRLMEECIFWFPDFELMTAADKIILGICYTAGECIGALCLPLVLISAGLAVYNFRILRSLPLGVSALVPAVYYFCGNLYPDHVLYRCIYPPVIDLNTKSLLVSSLAVGMIFFLFILLFLSLEERDGGMTAFFFGGALLLSAGMAFSPTFFVSFTRCVFFSREMLMLPTFFVFSRIAEEWGMRGRKKEDRRREERYRQGDYPNKRSEGNIMRVIKRFFWFLPTALWMAFIYGFSDQTGEESGELSLVVTEKIAEVVEDLAGERVRSIDLISLLHGYVRKAAHMTEYAILLVLLVLSFCAFMLAMRAVSLSIFVSFVYACIDEYHQTRIAGRAGQWTDVCIDMTGVLFAVMLLLFIYSFWQQYKETGRRRN
ncbi:MAG: VanZ family protein [Lachnospiraceae bacterium]|nr:VanZ family protein [Lachnospiraceae bacterium]